MRLRYLGGRISTKSLDFRNYFTVLMLACFEWSFLILAELKPKFLNVSAAGHGDWIGASKIVVIVKIKRYVSIEPE